MTLVQKKELRKEVKQYIDHADDRMLEAVHAMLAANQQEAIKISNEWLEEISDEEKTAIEMGLKQLDNGEGIPHKEAIKHMKWFPK